MLQAEGYTDIAIAPSAGTAFTLLGMDDPTDEPPTIDVILMDIRMPQIDGVEACRRIHAHDHLRDIPILMVTALAEREHLEAAFEAGAMDYIVKPYKQVELLVRLRSALALKEERDRRKARERDLLDVTRRLKEANRALEDLSNLDSLTGVANRRFFDTRFAHEWMRALREGAPLALIMLDIDHFKLYNDCYGHPQGDVCLRQVVGALRKTLKRPADLLARYGGEEFIILLPQTHRDGVRAVAEELRAAVEALHIPHVASPHSQQVTISLGAASVIPDRYTARESLLQAVDAALYSAKHEGRNRVRTGSISVYQSNLPARAKAPSN
jgi:diguanylate cyclase (GGDEF)-like protein